MTLRTFVHEGKPAHVVAKEKAMSTEHSAHLERSILTVDQAAVYLAISKATLYTWRTRRIGFGPRAVKFGGSLRYRQVDLDAWVAAHLEPQAGPDVTAPEPGRADALVAGSAGE